MAFYFFCRGQLRYFAMCVCLCVCVCVCVWGGGGGGGGWGGGGGGGGDCCGVSHICVTSTIVVTDFTAPANGSG